jgi:methoxymalonate biosynthesis acyl carrier protein
MNQGIVEQVRAFCTQTFANRSIGVDEDIFGSGFGNSLFAMQLVRFVEERFGFEIDGDDLEIANFRTIRSVSRLIEKKLAGCETGKEESA